MRRRAEWMTLADDEILEYLEKEGAGTPKSISDEIGRTNNYVGQKCRWLTEAGLVRRPSRGFYTITELGERYLEGGLDASELDYEPEE